MLHRTEGTQYVPWTQGLHFKGSVSGRTPEPLVDLSFGVDWRAIGHMRIVCPGKDKVESVREDEVVEYFCVQRFFQCELSLVHDD